MIRNRIRTTTACMAAAAIVAGGATGLVHGAGTASADYNRSFPLSQCFGLSPNIIDVPFAPPGINVTQYDGFTTLLVTFSSVWLGVGYVSDATLTWKHLDNGKHGTMRSHGVAKPPNTGTLGFGFPRNEPGKGRVELTLSAVNSNGLWSIPTNSCTATINIP